jgi:hypothetical protein
MCDERIPEAVQEALDRYRRLLDEHGPTWGEDPIVYVRQIETSAYLMEERAFWITSMNLVADRYPDADDTEFEARLRELDPAEVIRVALAGQVLDNLAALRLTRDGVRLDARPQAVLGGDASREAFRTSLLIDSSREAPAVVTVDGERLEIPPRGVRLIAVTLATALAVDGEPVPLDGLTRTAWPATIRLRAGFPCRWSVIGEDGQGWYPEGVPRRVDAHRMPYFHGDDLVLRVPAEPLTVRVTRGMEYTTEERTLTPGPNTTDVVMTPGRLYDAAARGWYGGDLHVHMNWAGDQVGTPAQAAAAQQGEDLHVLNLVAGNVAAERVYDREALEHWAGKDTPWSDATHLARFGVEYRNDLLGHFYAFGVQAPPGRYHTGFLGTADWPPNSEAAAELRELGAVLGYSHPFHVPFTHDSPPRRAITAGRNCSAREIVADAALGLIDALDVLNHSSIHATAAVYHRLLGAGNVLAVTAGTDAMLSFTRRGNQSSPPGWERVYARVDGPLTAESFADAVRNGRTFATTGPWLELDADGLGPGDVLDTMPGDRVTVSVHCAGPEVTHLEIRTAERIVAQGPPPDLTARITVHDPTYILAVASGPAHPRTYHHEGVYAITSPVYIDIDGHQVAHEPDVRWCLEYLDRLETLIRTEARLENAGQLAAHLELLDRARAIYRGRLPGQ